MNLYLVKVQPMFGDNTSYPKEELHVVASDPNSSFELAADRLKKMYVQVKYVRLDSITLIASEDDANKILCIEPLNYTAV